MNGQELLTFAIVIVSAVYVARYVFRAARAIGGAERGSEGGGCGGCNGCGVSGLKETDPGQATASRSTSTFVPLSSIGAIPRHDSPDK